MKIVVICEGKTERALRRALGDFVNLRKPSENRTGICTRKLDGHLLQRQLPLLVAKYVGDDDVTGVIALADVYPLFKNAQDAKARIRKHVGSSGDDSKFRAHAAQFEVEAWMIPFWEEIAKSLKLDAKKPGAKPEEIDSDKPPSVHLDNLFKRARSKYQKVLHASKWLTAERLAIAADQCPELKLFLNSLLEFAGAEKVA